MRLRKLLRPMLVGALGAGLAPLAGCDWILGIHTLGDDRPDASIDGGSDADSGSSVPYADAREPDQVADSTSLDGSTPRDATTDRAALGADAATNEAAADSTVASMPDAAASEEAGSDATVAPPQLTVAGSALTATAGRSVLGQFASITDTHLTDVASTLTATITWGDGTTSYGTISGGSGAFIVSSAHTYAAPGTSTLSIVVASSATGASANAAFKVTVRPEPTIQFFTDPKQECMPQDIVSGPSGLLWFTEANCGLATATTSGTINEVYLNPTTAVAPGASGSVWFTQGSSVGVTTNQGTHLTPLPSTGTPKQLVAGPDGNIWFTDDSGKIGKVDAQGTITEYPIPAPSSTYYAGPQGIVTGPDGRIWFTETAGGYAASGPPFRVGAVATNGSFTEYTVASASPPKYIAVGSDGALWLTEFGPHLGRITTSGAFTEFAVPEGEKLTNGPDGNLWIASEATSSIIRLSPCGAYTQLAPVDAGQLAAVGITTGPDANLWFTTFYTNAIGYVTP